MVIDEKVKEASHQMVTGMVRRQDGPWDGCSMDEKIERLRRELKGLRRAINEVRRRTQTFEEHEHNAKGEVVAPVRLNWEGETSGRDLLA